MNAGWRTLASLTWRESRTARRRLLLASSSITLGVAALVAIDSFAANITRSVQEQSRAILGGDIALSTRRGFSGSAAAVIDSLGTAGHTIARETSFPAMAALQPSGATRLVQVRAVSDSFPLFGEIVTEPAGRWRLMLSEGVAIVDPGLLIALDANIGDTITVGLARLPIAATVTDAPGALEMAQVLGPRVFIPERYVPETQLLVLGSTSSHDAYIRTRGDPAPVARDLRPRLRSEGVRVRTADQAEQGITSAVDQLRQFIGVIGMVALLLGGLGVASGVHAFVARKIDTVAVLRCLGATSGQVLVMYVAQAAVMGLAGAVIGAGLGVALQFLTPAFLSGLLPVEVSVRLEPRPVLLGLLVGAWVAVIFALRPLLALRHVSPLQTLRRNVDVAALRGARRDWPASLVTIAIVGSVFAIAFARATGTGTAIAIAAGTAIAIAALLGSAVLASWLARRLIRARWPYVVRQGLSNLHRPGNQTRPVALALGFGAFLVTTMHIVQSSVLQRFDMATTVTGANLVFFDVQPDQAAGLDSLVRAAGEHVLQAVPIVTMRIAAIGGQRAADLLGDTPRDTVAGVRGGRWALRREYRSTYRDSLTASERVTRGRWFTQGTAAGGVAEVSLEEDIARDLGVTVGDQITWDVYGVEIPTRITSLREVTWARFEPNFFAVFSPGALENAPTQFVLVARTGGPTATAQLQRAVVREFPNISSIDLSLLRQSVDQIVARVSTAIRFLALLSLALALPVMLSSVAATRRDRIREAVLLKTLGATRGTVAKIMAAEYAALGLLGSLTGMLLAAVAAWGLVHFVFKLPFFTPLAGPLAIALGITALTVALGLLSAREVFAHTPMEALREN